GRPAGSSGPGPALRASKRRARRIPRRQARSARGQTGRTVGAQRVAGSGQPSDDPPLDGRIRGREPGVRRRRGGRGLALRAGPAVAARPAVLRGGPARAPARGPAARRLWRAAPPAAADVPALPVARVARGRGGGPGWGREGGAAAPSAVPVVRGRVRRRARG